MSEEKEENHYLTESERRKVVAQVDYFVEVMAKKYEVTPQEVLDAVKWVRDRRDFSQKLKATGTLSILGIIISALFMTLWEGLKTVIRDR